MGHLYYLKNVQYYYLDRKYSSGKYEGKTVKDVLLNYNPSYIEWCIKNDWYFYISNEEIENIKKIKPNFALSTYAKKKVKEKNGFDR